MKKYLYIITFSLLTTLSSCGSLLDIKPMNSMIPVSLEDYQSVLLGGYPRKEFFMNTEYMTDNVYANLNGAYKPSKTQEAFYLWADTHQLDGETIDAYWGQLYNSVYYANTVIDELITRDPDAENRELYDRIMGEAYALRAYSYFYLVNLYADVYSEANLEKPGVPMPLTAVDVNVNSKDNVREPIGKVWDQIVKDMNLAAEKLSGKQAINKFRFDFVTVQLFRARVFLFMKNYADAITCSTDVINAKQLFDMNGLQPYIDENGTDKNAFGGDYGFTDTDYVKEILFYTGGKANGNSFYYDTYILKTSPELLALCDYPDKMDYRKYIFASFLDMSDSNNHPTGTTAYHFYGFQGTPSYYVGFELSEAYVTRAECYVRTNNSGKAIIDLNTLLVTRFRKGDFTPLVENNFTKEQLLTKVLNERRLENAFDAGMRWLDLRRLDKPTIEHVYSDGMVRTLAKNDLKYVLQIPVSEQESSPNMPLNPR